MKALLVFVINFQMPNTKSAFPFLKSFQRQKTPKPCTRFEYFTTNVASKLTFSSLFPNNSTTPQDEAVPAVRHFCIRTHKQRSMFLPGFRPGTFHILGERDNHYTMETAHASTVFVICLFLD